MKILERLLLRDQDKTANNYVVSYFFCKVNDKKQRNMRMMLQGLVYILLDALPAVLESVRHRYGSELDPKMPHHESHKSIIVTEILDYIMGRDDLGTVYLIIDGVHHLCEFEEGRDVLNSLMELMQSYHSVKWVISSCNVLTNSFLSYIMNVLDPATTQLLLTPQTVAEEFGLSSVVKTVTEWGSRLETDYHSRRRESQGCAETFSWLEYTKAGRAWLTHPNTFPPDKIPRLICYKSDRPPPIEHGLWVADALRKHSEEDIRAAYISLNMVTKPKSSNRKAETLNPGSALFCLFAQLCSLEFGATNSLLEFLIELSSALQASLRRICERILPEADLQDWPATTNTDESSNTHLQGYYQDLQDYFIRAIPPSVWGKFPKSLDDFVDLFAALPNRQRSYLIVIDNFPLSGHADSTGILDVLYKVLASPTTHFKCLLSGVIEDDSRNCVSMGSNSVQNLLHVNEHTEFLECLEALRFSGMHFRRNQTSDALEHTNDWLWNDSTFQKWETGGGLLWVSGKPGSGKSVLAKSILKKMSGKKSSDAESTKWLACDWFFSQRDTAFGTSNEFMLRSLLFQILEHNPDVFDHSKHYYRQDLDNFHHNQNSLGGMLRDLSIYSDLQEMLFIVDGIDESEDEASRKVVLEILRDVSRCVRIVMLSRPEPWMSQIIHNAHHITLHKHNHADIERLVDSQLDLMLDCLNGVSNRVTFGTSTLMSYTVAASNRKNPISMNARVSANEEAELQEIRAHLLDNASGVILWARLVTDQLLHAIHCKSGCTFAQLGSILRTLPTELDDLYSHILKKLGLDSNSKRRDMACLIFRWISESQAIEPLQLQDLRDALAIPSEVNNNEPADKDIIFNNRWIIGEGWNSFLEKIHDHCGPFVEPIEDSSIVSEEESGRVVHARPTWTLQLIHQTVLSFLHNPERGCMIPNQSSSEQTQSFILKKSYQYLSLVLPTWETTYAPFFPSAASATVVAADLHTGGGVITAKTEERVSIAECCSVKDYSQRLVEYFFEKPFTLYALRSVSSDLDRTRLNNWVADMFFLKTDGDPELNRAFPLWWVVAAFSMPDGLSANEQISEFNLPTANSAIDTAKALLNLATRSPLRHPCLESNEDKESGESNSSPTISPEEFYQCHCKSQNYTITTERSSQITSLVWMVQDAIRFVVEDCESRHIAMPHSPQAYPQRFKDHDPGPPPGWSYDAMVSSPESFGIDRAFKMVKKLDEDLSGFYRGYPPE
ncbi:hypothetical protein G7054_g2575 [Neopestalotiopsis clavispora]|nr:hypothetical protein G7054_g2575 [Neopestalotiopsis clavispora]